MVSWKCARMKTIATVMLLSLALGAFGCGNEQKAEKAKVDVGIVQLVEHNALDQANKGFVDGMASKGFKEGANVTYDRQNAQADQSNLQNIAQRFVSNKVDLICAIATPAVQTVANVTSDIPIVATAVTDYKSAKLVKDNNKPGNNVTGTSDMNPVERQLDLLVKLVPQVKVIGTIYCSSEVNSQLQVDVLKQAALAKGITVEEITVSNVNDIQQAARNLVGKVQAIYVPTDNVVASAMPTLTYITEEAKLPIICGESGPVHNGGLATVGIDYYKLGFQTGEMAADILHGKAKPAEMPIQTQKDFKTTINMKTAARIGLSVPEELLKDAEIIK